LCLTAKTKIRGPEFIFTESLLLAGMCWVVKNTKLQKTDTVPTLKGIGFQSTTRGSRLTDNYNSKQNRRGRLGNLRKHPTQSRRSEIKRGMN
jgi:hypothetical protein